MAQVLHQRAKTTHAIRADIQRSSASIAELSRHLSGQPAVLVNVEIQHQQETLGTCWIAVLNHDVEYQAAATVAQVQLVTVLHVPAALDITREQCPPVKAVH